MAEHGAKVVVSSRNQQACAEVADGINAKYGAGRALALAANISAKEHLKRLVDETIATFGQIDVLVCNAASNPHYGPMHTITDEQLRKILDNNIVSNHWLITLVAPGMIARKDGSIVIVFFDRRPAGQPGHRQSTASPKRPICSSRATSPSNLGRTTCA